MTEVQADKKGGTDSIGENKSYSRGTVRLQVAEIKKLEVFKCFVERAMWERGEEA